MESVLGALEEQVGGFYDPSKKTFFLLERHAQQHAARRSSRTS
jgi:hypothetical protein